MTASLTFDPALADGDRARIGLVGVDSGTMCIATRFPNNESDEWMPNNIDVPGWSGRGWGCSTSGVGDGRYDLLTVHRDGALVGLEVMFLSPAISAREDELTDASDAVKPTREQFKLAWSKTSADSAEPAEMETARELVRLWLAQASASCEQAWNELALTIRPASESTPQPFTTLTVSDVLGVGDPCYGGPSEAVAVPAGQYMLVAWQASCEEWGTRTVRLGAYLLPGTVASPQGPTPASGPTAAW